MFGLLSIENKLRVSDTFTRGDSAITAGSAETGQIYTAVAGTWGILSGKLYSVSGAQDDVLTIPALGNGTIECDISGDYTPSNYRYPHLLLRYVNSANHLICLLNPASSFALWKNVGGVFTKLVEDLSAAGVDGQVYHFAITLNEATLTATLDGARQISYTLTGSDATTFHPGVTTLGIKINKAGTPDTANTINNLICKLF